MNNSSITLLFIIFSLVGVCNNVWGQSAQKPKPKSHLPFSQSTINDFAENIQYQYKYGNGNVKMIIAVYYLHKKPPVALSAVAVKIDNLKSNINDVIEILKAIKMGTIGNSKRSTDKGLLIGNLVSLNISAANSKILTDYIIDKDCE